MSKPLTAWLRVLALVAMGQGLAASSSLAQPTPASTPAGAAGEGASAVSAAPGTRSRAPYINPGRPDAGPTLAVPARTAAMPALDPSKGNLVSGMQPRTGIAPPIGATADGKSPARIPTYDILAQQLTLGAAQGTFALVSQAAPTGAVLHSLTDGEPWHLDGLVLTPRFVRGLTLEIHLFDTEKQRVLVLRPQAPGSSLSHGTSPTRPGLGQNSPTVSAPTAR